MRKSLHFLSATPRLLNTQTGIVSQRILQFFEISDLRIVTKICVVLLIYPGSPGPNHKLINIHSVWCINLPENTTITISLKICDGNRFPATSDLIMSVDHRP